MKTLDYPKKSSLPFVIQILELVGNAVQSLIIDSNKNTEYLDFKKSFGTLNYVIYKFHHENVSLILFSLQFLLKKYNFVTFSIRMLVFRA